MRVIISAGGTGGHIYPAISIINKIKEKEPNSEILYTNEPVLCLTQNWKRRYIDVLQKIIFFRH